MGTANIVRRTLDLIYCENRKPYIILTNSLFCHIINTASLNNLEKLYYLLTDLYAHLGKKIEGLREAEKSGREWAKLLGCSEEWVFQMQKKLETSGYFHIIRKKDEDNQNEKNIIIPTIPDEIFTKLSKEPNRIGQEHLVFTEDNHEGNKRSFLDNTKLFIKINLQMFKLLLSDPSLSSLQKLIWLYCFTRSYISYADSYGNGTRNFITTYQELAAVFSCKENTISTAINNLSLLGYINKKQFRIQNPGKTSRRKKKSCWEIAALFPQDKMKILLQQPDRQNLAPLTLDDLRLYNLYTPDHQKNIEHNEVSNSIYYHDRSAISHETQQFNNKNNILNIKNIVTETTNNSSSSKDTKVNNVFYEKNLISSQEEVVQGLQVAEKFNAKVFELAEHTDYPQAIKQADAHLTNIEHWLVTKAAYTLQQKLTEIAQIQGITALDLNDLEIIKLKETMFNAEEQRLIELWHDLSNIPMNKLEQEEFLLRQSWIVKLLPQSTVVTTTPNIVVSPQSNITSIEKSIKIPGLPGDKEDKARKFAYALQKRNLAKGYAAEISTEELALEFIHHASTWYPEKLNCKTIEEQIDAALSFAWKAAEKGNWKCPYQWLNTQIYQREKEAAQWKQSCVS